MARSDWILKAGILGLLTAVGGCGSKNVPEPWCAPLQLRSIGLAYIRATADLGHPPQNKEELIPFLTIPDDQEKPGKKADPAQLFRSPTDDADFVILWGVDYRTEKTSGDPASLPVLAYEKHGKDGKRLVLQYRYVTLVTDEELASLPFPKGHRPP